MANEVPLLDCCIAGQQYSMNRLARLNQNAASVFALHAVITINTNKK